VASSTQLNYSTDSEANIKFGFRDAKACKTKRCRALSDTGQMVDPITVLERLLDDSQWPTYRNSGQHSRLSELAQEAYDRNTFDGYLSFVLMTSQACEDFARILLKNAQFTLQICLAIQGFGWHFPKKQTGDSLDKFMFGQLLDMLDHSVDFDQKKEFIDACKELSAVRNHLVHELDKGISLPDIKKLAEKCETLRGQIIDEFNGADEHFGYFFLEIVRDSAWNTLLKRKKHGATPDEATRIEALTTKLHHAREHSPLLLRTD
jgi:hypothetical protein